MKTSTTTAFLAACTLLATCLLPAAGISAPAQSAATPDESTTEDAVSIQVSPATIVLNRPVKWITIHAEIPYSAVLSDSITLNEIPADSVFADNRGMLVAKFYYSGFADLLAPPSAVMTLAGLTFDGAEFSGSSEVTVR